MKRFFLSTVAVLAASPILALKFATELPPAASGPPATVADMVAAHAAIQPEGHEPPDFLLRDQLLFPVAIDAPGKNGTAFHTDFFVGNGRNTSQEVLIAFLASGVSNVGQPAQRFVLDPNSVYSIDNFLGAGSGRLNKSGVGSILVNGVLTGTNTGDTSALLSGGVRIWTFEPGSTGTNSFTAPAIPPGTLASDVFASSLGSRSNDAFRSNFGLVNLDPTKSRTFTVNVLCGSASQMQATIPALSMAQLAFPAVNPSSNGFCVATAFPNDFDAFRWSFFTTTADNTTGDAWLFGSTQINAPWQPK